MSNPSTMPPLLAMLDEANLWRDRIGQEIDAAIDLLVREEADIRVQLEEAQRQCNAVSTVRREEEERLVRLEQELLRRRRAAVRQALVLDRALLDDRAAALFEAQARQDAAASRGLDDDPVLGAALSSWMEAREVSAGFSAARPVVAPSRDAMRRLEPYLQAAEAPPPKLQVEPAGVGVLVSADPAAGSPQALVLVLPVPWAVYAESAVRTEDLSTMLTYRLVAAVFGLLGELEAGDAPIQYVDVHGCLAIQVWLGEHRIAVDLKEILLEGIAAAVEGAPELEATSVEVYAVWLTPDLLAEGP